MESPALRMHLINSTRLDIQLAVIPDTAIISIDGREQANAFIVCAGQRIDQEG